MSEVLAESGVKLGAQDTFWELAGAYTGEVSPAMLKGWCDWVIVGHSERRIYLGETDEMVAKKTAAALGSELNVIMCVGELADHYDAGTSDQVVTAQVKAGLANCSADDSARLVIAYEPVWAIGTGRPATGAHASAAARTIRTALRVHGVPADDIRVLYGGSVSASTVAEFASANGVDGALVGGASLKPNEFAAIVRAFAA